MMSTFALTQCCRMRAIDAKTLRQWLRQANLPLHVHPTDARLKCLSLEQLQQLATLHGRPFPSPVSAPPAPLVAAAAQLQPQLPTHVEPVCDGAQGKTINTSSPTFAGEADLIAKLVQLETQVASMQHHLTRLALELLQERELRYERRLQALEAHVQQTGAPTAEPPPAPTQPEAGAQQARRPQPTPRRPRSRVLPLVEYAASGHYVVICPTEGELPLVPDSPEWFAWLASLSSFQFVGKGGRFSAHRVFHKGPTRYWQANRVIHQHRYKPYLGVTEHLTIDCLEQTAATLQSYLEAR